jgi:glycosyltransferase involved in cell wall biosynthesis
MNQPPFFSIIIPVYNGGDQFLRSLAALPRSNFSNWELIVVDDGSTDGSAAIAARFGARLLQTAGRQGPAAARNLGARLATGIYLFFVDADCELHPDALGRAARQFEAEPDLAALFGSYDDSPAAPNFIAQYKNLFHHYVHRHSAPEASTFWTGCGAIKRSVFLALGGFDVQRYRRPAIEDIELGYRLKQAGGRIRLAKEVQVKHLKAWTLPGLLRSDILDRGLPWSQLMWRSRAFLSDLNLQTHNRVSVVALYGLLLALLAGLFQPATLAAVLALAALLLWLNAGLYRFFYQKRGLLFTLRAIPLHWLYYFYNAISFGGGLWLYWQEQLNPARRPAPTALVDGHDVDGRGSAG